MGWGGINWVMGSDDLFKKAKTERDYKRKKFTRNQRDRILIICEGGKTEPEYFKGFGLTNVWIVGTGRNTDNLVAKAIELKKRAIREGQKYDQIWCVFDRDSFPAQNFNNAFILARQSIINIVYSNEAFELWYMLHFHYYDAALSRQDYCDRLSKMLGFKYEKKNPKMYEILIEKQDDAIRNAERLLSQYPSPNPEKDNPSTTVHSLVKELNKWLTN